MQEQARKKILIVDNNDGVLATFRQLFEQAGFDARTTWSGREALDLLASREFDVLLTDDYVPDLHYGEFLGRVAKLPVQPWIVVMQAGAPSPQQVRRYALLGALGVVRKHHLDEVRQTVFSCCMTGSLARTQVN